MNHTTAQFETALVKMGVMILEVNTPDGFVHEVSGQLNNIRYTWNAAGHCFRGNSRIKHLDIVFITDYIVSVDQKQITHFHSVYRFKKPIFKFSVNCSKCALLPECNSPSTGEDFPFPCHTENRTDKLNGFFKLK